MWYSDNSPAEQTPFFDHIIMMEWVACMITAIVICIMGRKVLFKKKLVFFTVLLLIFCTPFPVVMFIWRGGL
jgi:hypothetical protein